MRVRTVDRTEHRGTLSFASPDSLVFKDAAGQRTVMPTPNLVQIDAWRRRSVWSRMFRGALIGAAIGVAIPLVADGGSDWGSVVEAAPITGMLFAYIGAGIGAAVRSQHWQRVSLGVP